MGEWFSKQHTEEMIYSKAEDGMEGLNLLEYDVSVYTSDVWRAGTDANVTIELRGANGGVGTTRLVAKGNPFERKAKDEFKVPGSDIGEINSIVIGHDGSGFGSDWHLAKVRAEDRACNRFIPIVFTELNYLATSWCCLELPGGRFCSLLSMLDWPFKRDNIVTCFWQRIELPASGHPAFGLAIGHSPMEAGFWCPQVEVYHPLLEKTYLFTLNDWLTVSGGSKDGVHKELQCASVKSKDGIALPGGEVTETVSYNVMVHTGKLCNGHLRMCWTEC